MMRTRSAPVSARRLLHQALRPRVAALGVAALALVFAQAVPASAKSNLPVIYNVVAAAPAVFTPSAPPPGADNWSCKPTAAHPRPVVLVEGTGATMGENWATLSPLLADNGYCVFALNYGASAITTLTGGHIYAMGPIADSAAELSTFVNQVLAATGASQVDIVGHSQGGMMPNYYIKFLGGAAKVHTMVGLAPDNHGTTADGFVTLANGLATIFPPIAGYIYTAFDTVGAQGLLDQEVGSPFIQLLNSVPDTAPGVNYTVISTRYDEVVTPYTSQFLSGPNVTNITLQNQCFLDWSDHVAIAFDHIALQDVLNALDPAHARRPWCGPVYPLVGG